MITMQLLTKNNCSVLVIIVIEIELSITIKIVLKRFRLLSHNRDVHTAEINVQCLICQKVKYAKENLVKLWLISLRRPITMETKEKRM